jgi:hypothetical protein
MKTSLLFVLAVAACVGTEEDNFDVSADDQAADDAFAQSTQDGKADGELGYVAVARVARAAGLACSGDRIALAVAVAKAESGFRADATNTAGNSHGIDRGLWQINSYYHPNVSEACAFSPSCNARAMASISNRGATFRPWWTYVNGKHLPFMAAARNAQANVCSD